MPLPWRDDLMDILSEYVGENAKVLLPGLWFDIGRKLQLLDMHTWISLRGSIKSVLV